MIWNRFAAVGCETRSFVQLSVPFKVVSLACALLLASSAAAQVITIDKQGNAQNGTPGSTVDRRYAQIEPTHVQLTKSALDAKTRLELERLLQAEQGFAMRPFPKGHKGLTLEANGKLEPAGESYLDMVTAQGMCAKPGDRVVLTDVKFDKKSIIFMLNGGPDAKHRFLRHIQLGTGTQMNPVVQDDGTEAQGARLTLAFKEGVPELTASDVKALLSPLISFDVKTPIQAFTDTLPAKLKDAILNHQVMVGMSTEMVIFALGPPESKQREMDGQMPFEEWIYGAPPKPVEFVRINGNRVIRLEIAKVGEAPQIFTTDEVTGLMRTDGSPLAPPPDRTKTVALGDKAPYNPDTQAAPAPPSLRKDGESLPQDDPKAPSTGVMKPVQFPDQKPDDYPDASKLPRTPASADKTPPPPSDDDDSDSGKPVANPPAPTQPAPPPTKPN